MRGCPTPWPRVRSREAVYAPKYATGQSSAVGRPNLGRHAASPSPSDVCSMASSHARGTEDTRRKCEEPAVAVRDLGPAYAKLRRQPVRKMHANSQHAAVRVSPAARAGRGRRRVEPGEVLRTAPGSSGWVTYLDPRKLALSPTLDTHDKLRVRPHVFGFLGETSEHVPWGKR